MRGRGRLFHPQRLWFYVVVCRLCSFALVHDVAVPKVKMFTYIEYEYVYAYEEGRGRGKDMPSAEIGDEGDDLFVTSGRSFSDFVVPIHVLRVTS